MQYFLFLLSTTVLWKFTKNTCIAFAAQLFIYPENLNLPAISNCLQSFRPVQLAPHHRLCWEQRVGQEEPSTVPDALQKFTGCQAGLAGQWGALGSHASKLQQHTHRTEAGEAGELNQQRERPAKWSDIKYCVAQMGC